MQHLSGLDNLFLEFEGNTHPMHVAAMGLYDPSSAPGGTVRFKTVLDFFSSKINQVPFFRRRLVHAPMWIDRPHWIDDGNVDVEYHVRHIALPEPGDWRQLMIQVARIHSRPLDMTRPLWEAYVIGGLDNIEGIAKGSFALYIKMHHAGIDGQGGAKLIQILHSLSPEYHPVDKPSVVYVDNEPSGTELVLRGIVNQSKKAAKASRLTFFLSSKAVNLSNKYGPDVLNNIKELVTDTIGIGDSEKPDKEKRSVTRFDGDLSSHRVVDAFGISLSDCQAIRRNIPGVSVNDIFMSATGGGLRSYLAAHKDLPKATIKALMPLAAMGDSRDESSSNNVSMMAIPIFSNIKDPLVRLRKVKEGATKGIELQDDLGRDLMPKVMDILPAVFAKRLTRLTIFKESSMTISNVRGPDVPLYLAGARMQMFMPISVPIDGVGLNVTGFSYAGTLWVTLVACRDMVPDPEFLAACLKGAFKELLEASEKAKGKEIEKEKQATEKAKEKEKVAAEKLKEKEKEKLAADKAKEKEKQAAEKLKEKEKEKEKLAADKTKEKEKLAAEKLKEKEKLAAQKAKEKEKATKKSD